eukprot:355604-Chlamydomonas_euryale.AAC.1
MRKMREGKAALGESLFCLHPVLGPAILRVRKACLELSAMRLHCLQPGVIYSLDEMVARCARGWEFEGLWVQPALERVQRLRLCGTWTEAGAPKEASMPIAASVGRKSSRHTVNACVDGLFSCCLGAAASEDGMTLWRRPACWAPALACA